MAGQEQKELFSEFKDAGQKKTGMFSKKETTFGGKLIINLSYENIILGTIALIMGMVIVFSLGVEKGKRTRLSGNDLKSPQVQQKTAESAAARSAVPVGTVAPAPAPVAPSAGQYTIQVVAYKKIDSVSKEIERLKLLGYNAFAIPSGEWQQVCAGNYRTREEAEKELNTLRAKYPTCYIRRIQFAQ